MTTVITFAILGLGSAAAYTLLSQGLVLIYRGSGVLNFAHGAFALLAAYLDYELSSRIGMAGLPAFLISIVAMAGFGAAVYWLIIKRLRGASTVTTAVATLGLLILIQGASVVIWGADPQNVTSLLPTSTISVGSVTIGINQLILFGIALVLTAVVWAATRFTAVGLALRASAENPTAASALGWSADTMGFITWTVGGLLAGVPGDLIAPLTAIDSSVMPWLIIPVLAASLFGGLASFPIAMIASVGIGVVQSELTNYANVQGISTIFPFALIMLFLVVRGRGLPARSHVLERLPAVGSGRIRLSVVIPLVAILGYLIYEILPLDFVEALTITFGWALILLSVVVLLGYGGQLSLTQFALGGVAALLAVHLINSWHFGFVPAALVAIAVTVPLAVILALPALRTRGIDLAVVTLGVAVGLTAMIFDDGGLTGGTVGLPTGTRTLFGINIDPILNPASYSLVVFLVFVVCALAVANLRRGSAGRRLIAVRTNERAAAALGISVFSSKIYAFALSGALAGLGGILIAFTNSTLTLSTIDPVQSVLAVAYVIVGSVGFVVGPVVGATLVSGSVGTWILDQVFPNANPSWLSVIGGVSVIALVVINQNGIISAHVDQLHWLGRRFNFKMPNPLLKRAEKADATALEQTERVTVEPQALEVSGLQVRFGSVTAVDGASVRVEPGTVVGLIGPNGAGKTTFIDAVTGFVSPSAGEVRLGGSSITGLGAHRRAGAGLSRSFQSLELFESSTVRENITIGSDRRGGLSWITSLVLPRAPKLSAVAAAAVRELELEEYLDVQASELSYGKRRLVAIARAIATAPSVLMLDEPAAGLSGTEVRELAVAVRRLADEWGMGILLVEHDMSFVMEVCDRLAVLNFGHQIADGTVAEVRNDSAVIAAYLGVEDIEDPADAPLLAAAQPQPQG